MDATWYVRAAGTSLDARIVLEVEDGYHIYHTDLGHPAASGKPTTLSFKSSGVTFGEVSFPASLSDYRANVSRPDVRLVLPDSTFRQVDTRKLE